LIEEFDTVRALDFAVALWRDDDLAAAFDNPLISDRCDRWLQNLGGPPNPEPDRKGVDRLERP